VAALGICANIGGRKSKIHAKPTRIIGSRVNLYTCRVVTAHSSWSNAHNFLPKHPPAISRFQQVLPSHSSWQRNGRQVYAPAYSTSFRSHELLREAASRTDNEIDAVMSIVAVPGPSLILQIPCSLGTRYPYTSCVSNRLRLVLLCLPDCENTMISLDSSRIAIEKGASPARRKGRANPVPGLVSYVHSGHWRLRKPTHEAPVLEGKSLLQRVEWQVGPRTLGVVVWAGHLRAGGLEATAGDEGWGRGGAEGSTCEHLVSVSSEGNWRGTRRTLAVLMEWRVLGCLKLA
jgi:hypothetical protein